MTGDHSPWARSAALASLRLLRPHDLVGARKLRVGRLHDGGYTMVDRFEAVRACYSLGINDDVSWDLQMALNGADVYQYDPTIQALPRAHDRFHWFPEWIGDVVDEAERRQTLENAIRTNGHAGDGGMVLKCDIEGHEWPLLQSTPNAVLRQFSQMVFEFHGLGMLAQPEHSDNVRAAFANLTASHHVVHVHGNNHADWTVVGGIPVPDVIELTLVRKDMGEFVPSRSRFPTPLDMPCHPGRADMELGRFDFG